jgi:hypothetical protein
MTGMAVALMTMVIIWFRTSLAWTWYVITGTVICAIVGYLVSLITASSGESKPTTGEDATLS